jgi:SAM-dependent methyltransferase
VTEPLQSRQPTVSTDASPAQFVDDEASAQDAHINRSDMDMDTRVPTIERFKWPKVLPALSSKQQSIADEFMQRWHEVLPRRYGAIERFNHGYPLRHLPAAERWRTLELGAGIGNHLEFESLDRQEYHCIELRPEMAAEIRRRYPSVVTLTADCQQRIPYDALYFDRVVVVHVLEHLPDLPAAIAEINRVTRPGGLFSAVLPCDPGLVYELARKLSAERLFKATYRMPYRWLVRREHINSPEEILQEIRRRFDIFDMVYFPLVVPVINLNLCIGVTARKPRLARSV